MCCVFPRADTIPAYLITTRAGLRDILTPPNAYGALPARECPYFPSEEISPIYGSEPVSRTLARVFPREFPREIARVAVRVAVVFPTVAGCRALILWMGARRLGRIWSDSLSFPGEGWPSRTTECACSHAVPRAPPVPPCLMSGSPRNRHRTETADRPRLRLLARHRHCGRYANYL